MSDSANGPPRVVKITVEFDDGGEHVVDLNEYDMIFWNDSALQIINPFYEHSLTASQTVQDLEQLSSSASLTGHTTAACRMKQLYPAP